jgi:hypothetical protein
MEAQTVQPPKRTLASRHQRLIVSVITLILVLAIQWIARTFERAKGTDQAVQSASNLRDLGQAIMIYTNDNGHFPNRLGDVVLSDSDLFSYPQFFLVPWSTMTPPAGATPRQMADQINGGGHCSYEYFMAGKTVADATPDTIMACEDDGENPTHRVCVVFGDGRVEALSPAQIIENFNSQRARDAAKRALSINGATAATAP